MPALRRCLDCRALTRDGPRCDYCKSERERARSESRLITEPWRAAYNSPEWAKATRACLLRDEYQCRAKVDNGRCEETTDLEAHHNPPLEELWQQGRNPFDLRYLVTLCKSHHRIADAMRRERTK